MKYKPLFYVFLWLAVLFVLSSDYFSYLATRKLIKDAMLTMDPQISLRAVLRFHSFLRKFLHVFNYMILSWLMACAFTSTMKPISLWNTRVGLLSFLACVIFSISDELRQSLSAVRTPMLFDVVLDSSGAFLVQLTCMAIVGRRYYKKASNSGS